MVECDYCEEEFEDKRALHLHWGEEHEDEINSHEQEKVKKAKREKEKDKQRKRAQYRQYSYYVISIIALVGLGAAGYLLMPEGAVLDNSETDIGPAGSAHTHADFLVVIDGDTIDFSQRQYQVVSDKAHVEGGNGRVVHGHAEGATFRFFLNSLGFDYNATYLETPGEQYFENGKQVKMFVDTSGDWREIEPKALEFSTGDRILLTYGNYSSSEIEEFQNAVTEQSASMS